MPLFFFFFLFFESSGGWVKKKSSSSVSDTCFNLPRRSRCNSSYLPYRLPAGRKLKKEKEKSELSYWRGGVLQARLTSAGLKDTRAKARRRRKNRFDLRLPCALEPEPPRLLCEILLCTHINGHQAGMCTSGGACTILVSQVSAIIIPFQEPAPF